MDKQVSQVNKISNEFTKIEKGRYLAPVFSSKSATEILVDTIQTSKVYVHRILMGSVELIRDRKKIAQIKINSGDSVDIVIYCCLLWLSIQHCGVKTRWNYRLSIP